MILAVGLGDIHIRSRESDYLPSSSLSELECQLREATKLPMGVMVAVM
jgi:hypothetical protein